MFPQQPQQQFRNTNADVQLFYSNSAWAKPPGVSHVYMMLIGGGGLGNGTSGGGSGAVTVWYGAAQHVPDSLVISVSTGDSSNTTVNYRSASGLITLLTAEAGVGPSAGASTAANPFTASGFFRSTAGQSGGSNINASTTTFLSGGGTAGNSVSANYGYVLPSASLDGIFMLQPIIVGAAGKSTGQGSIGCGNGASNLSSRSPGLVLIASW